MRLSALFKQMLKKRVLSDAFVGECIYSVNMRAKWARFKALSGNGEDSSVQRKQPQDYYALKKRFLAFYQPVAYDRTDGKFLLCYEVGMHSFCLPASPTDGLPMNRISVPDADQTDSEDRFPVSTDLPMEMEEDLLDNLIPLDVCRKVLDGLESNKYHLESHNPQ